MSEDLTKRLNILLISGASGSGKTFIRDMIVKYENEERYNRMNFNIPLQVTTRERRINEFPDDYIFIDETYYNELEEDGRLTATTIVGDKYYGTLKKTLVFGANNCNIIVANKNGICNIEKDFNNINYENLKIKKILVLSNIDKDIIESHNRNIDYVRKELQDLLEIPFDMYIPNYQQNRVTPDELFTKYKINDLF